MCGICGYIGPKSIESEILWEMNNTMFHRGPNDGGIWQRSEEGYEVGLAQRRLSILDLSDLGHQPMLSKDGRFIIVYNGEIYNFKSLRQQLENKNYQFCSNCDTEVILYAYAAWGKEAFCKFNGMFAIAIYDIGERKLIIARDRMGKKPLYYYYADGHFVFGSELKPILKYPFFEKNINESSIGNFLCNKYLVSPTCIFENTFKLEPGMILEFQNKKIIKTLFWDIKAQYLQKSNQPYGDMDSCIEHSKKILTDAVELRLIADVPIGTFLSGGIDSALITAIAQKVSDQPINTYSIGFYDKEKNEAPYAAEIARYLGTRHHEYYIGEKDILALLSDLPRYYDEPFSDSSQLPTMLVSQYASQDITVALSGDGGDEVFCGYKMYDWTWIAQHFDWIGTLAYHMPARKHFQNYLPAELRAFINNRNTATKTQLYIDVMIEEAQKILGRQLTDIKHAQEAGMLISNWQERRMLLDMQTYLPDEILTKTDRASMKYSLEVRCPLLDYRLVEESFRIPHKYKYHHFEKKYILKQMAYQYIPQRLLDRPKKGFSVPLRKWLRTVLKEEIVHYADPGILKQQGIFYPSAVRDLIVKQSASDKIVYSSLLWSFYMFQKWYQMYIEDLW